MNRLAVAAGRGQPRPGVPGLRLPARAQGRRGGGRPRRHQPVRDHLGRKPLRDAIADLDAGALPGLGRHRPRDAGHRHLRRDRGDDRRDARPARPGRRDRRLRAVLRELRPGRDPVRRGAALRHAPRAGLVDRPGRAARGLRAADPGDRRQLAAQPDRQGVHARGARADRRRCASSSMRSRSPTTSTSTSCSRASTSRSRRCPGWPSGPCRSTRCRRRTRSPAGGSAGRSRRPT